VLNLAVVFVVFYYVWWVLDLAVGFGVVGCVLGGVVGVKCDWCTLGLFIG